MARVTTFVATLCVLCVLVAGCSKDESAAVEQAFEEYKAAIVAGDGAKAVSRVTQSTVDYYGNLKRLTLEAGADEIRALSFTDKASIGLMRALMDLSYLRQLTPEQVFMYAVQEKWIGEGAMIQGTTIEGIRIDGERADAAYVASGRTSPFRFEFMKESGMWKVDLTSLIAGVDQMFRKQMASGGGALSEEQLVLSLLNARTGKKLGPEIWNKPKIK